MSEKMIVTKDHFEIDGDRMPLNDTTLHYDITVFLKKHKIRNDRIDKFASAVLKNWFDLNKAIRARRGQ